MIQNPKRSEMLRASRKHIVTKCDHPLLCCFLLTCCGGLLQVAVALAACVYLLNVRLKSLGRSSLYG